MKISLKGLRVNKNLTQKEVAKRLGTSRETILNWENGKTLPDVMMLFKLCNLYDCTIDDVFLPEKLAKRE